MPACRRMWYDVHICITVWEVLTVDVQHFFVLNPAAGYRSAYEELQGQLAMLSPVPYTLYITNQQGDAQAFVRETCQSLEGPLRFYACGGDGTLGEVAAGAMGYANAAVGVWPRGSGNDYVKCFGGPDRFGQLQNQLTAPTELVDLIQVGDKAAINVVNIGLEAHAAKRMLDYRHHLLFGGRRAYYVGVLSAVLHHMKTDCVITADGQPLYEGPLLTASFASGRYVGGGFACAPQAIVDDGLMEVCAILPMSRKALVKWLPVYKKGVHLSDPAFAPYLRKVQAKQVEIACNKETSLCLDGEIIKGDHFTLQVQHKAVRFILPKG